MMKRRKRSTENVDEAKRAIYRAVAAMEEATELSFSAASEIKELARQDRSFMPISKKAVDGHNKLIQGIRSMTAAEKDLKKKKR